MILNILDQSPVTEGMSHYEAVNNTIELAVTAEQLGYKRFWVSEHHNSPSFASASPELMVTRIASATNKIRVGTGGILLPHYSALKTAEQINMLETLFPQRIDIGIGRAPGGNIQTAKELNPEAFSVNSFERFDKMYNYCRQGSRRQQKDKITAYPLIDKLPEFWILGTSRDSAVFAAERGLPYSFGSFINDDNKVSALTAYFNNFKPSIHLEKPYLNLGLLVYCAESPEEAGMLARSSQVWFIKTFLMNIEEPFPSKYSAEKFDIPPALYPVIEQRKSSAIIGTPRQVKERLLSIKKQFEVDEFTLVTITAEQKDKIKSYKLIADEIIKI